MFRWEGGVIGQAVAIDLLRARIRELEGARVVSRRVRSGVAAVDALVDGLPQPGIVEICGPAGSGRTSLALQLVRQQPAAAWVDFERSLYPPAVAASGVDLRRLLLLRPAADRGIWAVEQVLRAGCYSQVVVSEPPPLRRAGQRWVRAAEAGGCTLFVLRERAHRDLPADMRLQLDGQRVSVLRNRGGRIGRSQGLPALSPGTDPWR